MTLSLEEIKGIVRAAVAEIEPPMEVVAVMTVGVPRTVDSTEVRAAIDEGLRVRREAAED